MLWPRAGRLQDTDNRRARQRPVSTSLASGSATQLEMDARRLTPQPRSSWPPRCRRAASSCGFGGFFEIPPRARAPPPSALGSASGLQRQRDLCALPMVFGTITSRPVRAARCLDRDARAVPARMASPSTRARSPRTRPTPSLRHLARHLGADRKILLNRVPRARLQLLQAEAQLALLAVDAQHQHLDGLARLQHGGGVLHS